MKDLSICSPDLYYTPRMQKYIYQKCQESDKKWIYRMIQGKPCNSKEVIYIDNKDWMLCKDIHPGPDTRYLIVFKNLELKTIRDLRQEHVALLINMKRETERFLFMHHGKHAAKFQFFFHYTPSVYQLHAHISVPGSYYNHSRSHPLGVVVRNLVKNSFHYRDGMILFSLNKNVKALGLHEPVVFLTDPSINMQQSTHMKANSHMQESTQHMSDAFHCEKTDTDWWTI